MMPGRRRFAAAVLAATIMSPDRGQAAPTNGFTATGTVVVQASVSGSPLNVGGTIALYERGGLYRLDLLSLGFPGTNPTASALAGALLAPGGATLVYDGATGAISAYSLGNHAVYETDSRTARKAAQPTPPADASAGGPLATLAAVAGQLRDVQRATLQLVGHGQTNGHPTADFDLTVRRQRPGKALEDYHAQIALADDLDGLPVRIAFTSTPPSPQDFGGSLALDLTAVTRGTPDASVFAVPAGLTRVASIGEVLQAKP